MGKVFNHQASIILEPFMNMSPGARVQAKRRISAYLKSRPKVAAILVSHREEDIPRNFDLGMEL